VKRAAFIRSIVLAVVLAGLLVGSLPALAAGPGATRKGPDGATARQHERGWAGQAATGSRRQRDTKAITHGPRVRASSQHRVAVTAKKTAATSATAGLLAGAAGSPSGVAMPVGNLPGWRQVLADDFTGATLDSSRWRLYWGQPGGDPGGWFDPNHVSVSKGQLVISGYRDRADGGKWATGGISDSPGLVQTYGKYLVRFRFDAGQGIAHAILLWPADNSWPPEIDFSEDNGSNRQTAYGTLHYGANNTQVQSHLAVNLTQWHTLGVQWTPGSLVYTLDGRAWASVKNAQVPSIPMTLDIQTQAWACGTSTWEQCPSASTPSHVNLYVDWAVAYSMS
jgi:beta-glucanase (GH16 family)